MIDFPSPATEGQTFEDDDSNVWQYNNGKWGKLITQVENIDDLNDVEYVNPNVDEFLYFDKPLEKWTPDVLKADDYFFKIGLSTDWFYYNTNNTLIPFNNIIEEYGTTGRYSTSKYEYNVPQTGIWQFGIYCHIENTVTQRVAPTEHRYLWMVISGQEHLIDTYSSGANDDSDKVDEILLGGSVTLNLLANAKITPWIDTLWFSSVNQTDVVKNDNQTYFWGSMVG